MGKKALAVVSFGTSYPAAREDIERIERALAAARPDYDFYRAFTSGMIIKKIVRTEGVHVLAPEELMQQLLDEGYDEVICQSLHVIPGNEYEKMCTQLAPYGSRFARLEIGKPLLWEETDYLRCARALLAELPKLAADEAIVFMGHGSEHPSNAAYALMENTFRFQGAERIYMATVEGFPNFDYILRRLYARQVTKVYLYPFMIVAGDHAQNDLAGTQEDSWKSQLENEGYDTVLRLQGLGSYSAISDIFVAHLPEIC